MPNGNLNSEGRPQVGPGSSSLRFSRAALTHYEDGSFVGVPASQPSSDPGQEFRSGAGHPRHSAGWLLCSLIILLGSLHSADSWKP